MNKIKTFIFLIVLISHFNTYGCSCSWGGGFLKNIKYQKLIVSIKVDSYITQEFVNKNTKLSRIDTVGMNAEIIQILKGKEVRKFVRIFGDNGVLCRPYIQGNFNVGEYYIINLIQSEKGDWSVKDETNNDYFVSICSENWLKYDKINSTVYGRVKRNKLNSKMTNFNLEYIITKINEA